MSEEKIYCGAAKEFGQFGDLKVSINVRGKDGETIIVRPNDKGWINLIVSKRKTPDARGNTHSVRLDTWKPAEKPVTSDADLPF
jgi:hypothetical protein